MRTSWLVVFMIACYDPIYGEPVGGGGDSAAPTGFPADVEGVFSANCAGSGCHWGGTLNPKLSDGYDAVVGVESSAGAAYIEAGDADNSYIYAKILGVQEDLGGGGSDMPLGGSLSEDDRTVLADWITAGAAREE